jgi:DNA-binding LytR/AlgR family response regulator
MPSAVIADDEPLLRRELRELLAELWPELQIAGEYSDGGAVLRAIQDIQPTVAFLDIRMPILSGLQVAEQVSGKCLIVYISAFDEHALTAFEQGAADYIVKPIEAARLAATVVRLRERIAHQVPDGSRNTGKLERIQAIVGKRLLFFSVDEICYCRSDSKYTRIVTANSEALISRSIASLSEQLDASRFWKINRGIVVNIDFVDSITRDELGGMTVHLRDGRGDLPVSKAHQSQFRGM